MDKIIIEQTQHKLRIDSERFNDMIKGKMRDIDVLPLEKFKVGHRLLFRETIRKNATGREIVAVITEITDNIHFKKLCIVDGKF